MANLITRQSIILLINQLDCLIGRQLSLITSTLEFNSLLSLWSELHLMCSANQSNQSLSIKLLDITWKEIDKDINTIFELENSTLFQKICEDEFGAAGGEPFGILLANYQLNIQKLNIISTLNRLCELSSIALTMLLTNLSLEIFSSDFMQGGLDDSLNISKEIEQLDLSQWNKLRKNLQTRFLYLTFPNTIAANFLSGDRKYSTITTISISAITLLTIQIIKSFKETNWFSDILGFFDASQLNFNGLPLHINNHKVTLNCKYFLKNQDEKVLTEQGILPLIQHKKNMPLYFANIYSANIDSKSPGLLLEHMLAACRFGHLIKAIARQKIGSMNSEAECERFIAQWLNRYTGTFQEQALRYKFPLKNHLVKIHKIPGKVGCYNCQILLEPHMKLESLNAQILLHSEIYTGNM